MTKKKELTHFEKAIQKWCSGPVGRGSKMVMAL